MENQNNKNIYYKIKNNNNNESSIDFSKIPSSNIDKNVFKTINENFSFVEEILGKNIGLVKEVFKIFNINLNIGVAYIKCITDEELLNSKVLKPILDVSSHGVKPQADIIDFLKSQFICASDVSTSGSLKEIITELLKGNTVLFIDSITDAIIIKNSKYEKRSIDKPENEVSIYASKDALTEDIDSNCSLILKRLQTPDVHIENITLGTFSKTTVKLIWIEGAAKPQIIQNVYDKIKSINVPYIDNINIISELLLDKRLQLFPLYKQTERPDVITKYLIDGHFAILCNNSPSAIIAPISLWDNFKTMDDYSEPPIISSYIRIIRVFSFILSMLVSSIYLSFVTYNHIIVPPSLGLNIILGRQGVPFPSIIELILMTLIVDIIREAGIRMPGLVGYFIGTFGAVIIGQTAVAAGYVSVALIIVVAVSSIASFAISSSKLVNASRIINYIFIILSGVLGMFGLLNGIVLLILYLVSLNSFDVPYLYPVVPLETEGQNDNILRLHIRNLKKRLSLISPTKIK